MRSFLASAFVLSLCTTLVAQTLPKPDQDAVVRVETNLVQVRAVVTDKSGKLIDNLKQGDFELLENGRPQSIGFWSLERTANDQSQPQGEGGVPADNSERATRRAPARPKRTIVLFVDTLHLSASSLLRAKQQLKKLVDEQISDDDLVAVVTTSASIGLFQQFMRDRKMLRLAIDKIPPFVQRSSYFTPYLANEVIKEGYTPHGDGASVGGALAVATQIMAAEEYGRSLAPPPGLVLARAREIAGRESYFRRVTLQTLLAVSAQLGAMPGQRLVAFFSDGFTVSTDDRQEFSQAIGRAARQGVLVYSFSPQGLQTPVEFTAAAPVGGIGFSRYMHESQLDLEQTLRDVAYPTGGDAYVNSNDIPGQFKKMLEANSVYYAMGYYAVESDKKLRDLKVRVRNHPDYHVRTQRGYQLSTEQKSVAATTPQEKLFQAMLAPLPLTNISVTSSSGFLVRGDDEASVSLQVHVDGNSLEYPEKDGKFAFGFEVLVAVFDHSAKVTQSFSEDVKGSLTAAQVATARRSGFRYSNRLRLGPGVYQVRIGVRELAGNMMGTAMSWVSVPDLKSNRAILSSIFLGKAAPELGGEVTVGSDKKSKRPKLLVGPPSFRSGEEIFYRCVLYKSGKTAQPDSSSLVRLEVLEADKPVYEGTWQPLSARTIGSDGVGTEIGGQISAKMPAGIYTLRLSVKDSESKQAISQTIEFELEP